MRMLLLSGVLALLLFLSVKATGAGQRDVSSYSGARNVPFEAPKPYKFGYRFRDNHGNMQAREERVDSSGATVGSYSYVDAKGIYRRVEYVADEKGFRAVVTTNEPGTSNSNPAHVQMRSGNLPQQVLHAASKIRRPSPVSEPVGTPVTDVKSVHSNPPSAPDSSLLDYKPQPLIGEEYHSKSPGLRDGIQDKPSYAFSGDKHLKAPDTDVYLRPFEEQLHNGPSTQLGEFGVKYIPETPGSGRKKPSFTSADTDKAPPARLQYRKPSTRRPRDGAKFQSGDGSNKFRRRLRPLPKIHIPQGAEDGPNLPTYRDK